MFCARPYALLGTGLAVLLLVTACGTPTAARRARPAPGNPVVGQRLMPLAPMGQPGLPARGGTQAGAVAAHQMSEVSRMRMAVQASQQRVQGFTATIDTFDKGPKGQESNSMRVTFKKPSSLKIEMTKASGQAAGARILWTGGDNLRIKPSFLPMAVEKSIRDEQTVSKNGWSIKETEVNAIIRIILDPQAQIKPLGTHPIDGRPLSMYEVRSRLSPQGASHEVVGVDPQSALPNARLIYKGGDLIYKAIIKNMSIRAVSSDEMSL